jgi:hypothetical protein
MVVEDVHSAGQEAVVSRVKQDLHGKATAGQVMRKIAELRQLAHQQIMTGTSTS